VALDRSVVAFNFGDWFGLEQYEGYNGVTSNIIRVNEISNAHLLLAELYRVGREPARPEQSLVFEGANGLRVYRNPDAFPRVWTAHSAEGLPDTESVLARLGDPLEQLRKRVLLTGSAPPLETCDGDDAATLESHGQSRVIVTAEMRCKGMLVLSDTWFPGWSARVDGHPTPIYEAYGLIRGVVVPAGTHTVEFRYRPLSVIAGAGTTLFGFALLILKTAVRR